MRIKAVFWDIDNTILDYEKCSERAMEAVCQRFGTEYSTMLLGSFRRIDEGLWERQNREELTVEEVFQKRAEEMLAVMGLDLPANAFLDTYAEEFGETTELVDGVEQALAECREKGCILYCASNGVHAMQVHRLEKAGLLDMFRDVYVSDDIGYEKPDHRFFDTCLSRSGVKKEEALMIGDGKLTDIEGAMRAGWHACWFDKKDTKKYVMSYKKEEEPCR